MHVEGESGDKIMLLLLPGFAVSIREIVCEEGVSVAVTTIGVTANGTMRSLNGDVSLLERCPHFRGWYAIESGPDNVLISSPC